MTDSRLFSLHYSADTTKYEDKKKFRNRMIKYLHDVINEVDPQNTQKLCRQQMGITIPAYRSSINILNFIYDVENEFCKEEIEIHNILDLITVVYDSWDQINSHSLKSIREKYVININKIFSEESMCYVLHDDGKVRYYPDEEFQLLVKSTLSELNNKSYAAYLKQFNNVLDEFYKKRSEESPIQSFFALIESFVLAITKKGYKQLNAQSVEELHKIISSKVNNYTPNDLNALEGFKEGLMSWIKMCHKYRHGKGTHAHAIVPIEIFDYIFSAGISIYRSLLQLNEKFQLGI
ncbi:hypothetical protein [Legionella brunensis]|uniref:Uncharacterized protein n=1 Tax=Legionella brunensis TaxID=29422 RepID=A0A0W0SK53_9GAMM|nr:hypothetical protein [Legionella brunensis]KTC83710.1 hypothetical protein Lbru_1679 [Legionella brunensis]